ncbi:response regulator transcription factor [Asticcacaulis endophyticus]|uniref:response regulator transcription factor n=1 Tax=Asticcacaulis endophyticus TaxID=1395890 RepID=UPI001675D783|nr:helix-turn-helix transcriptional regulator [Asticcacaulis endophyticus]
MAASLTKIEELSQRQREILRLTSQHLQAKEIARLLKISEHTVKTHKDEARKRLGVSTSREAALLFASYEAEFPLPPGEGDRSRGIVNSARIPPSSSPTDAVAPTVNEDADDPKQAENRSPPDDLIDRSSDRLGDAGEPGQIIRNPEHNLGSGNANWRGRPVEGGLYSDRRHGMADQRGRNLIAWLASLTPIQCIALVVIAAGTIVVFMAGLIACVLGIMTAAQYLKSQSG